LSDRALTFALELPAPPERAFAAITEARHLRRWFCDVCESEPRPNGRLIMRWTRSESSPAPFEARWVEFSPPSRAAFQGGHAGYPAGNAGVVWLSVEPAGTGSRLEVRHELPPRGSYEELAAGWRSAWPRALERLARYLEPVERTKH